MELENMLKEFDESTKELQEELEKSVDVTEEEVVEEEAKAPEEATEETVTEEVIEPVAEEEEAEKSVDEPVIEEVEEAEKSLDPIEDVIEDVEKSAKEDDKEDDKEDKDKEKPKKKKKKGEDEEEDEEGEEKEEAKKSVSLGDAEGLFKSILESYKASVAINKSLLETNKQLIKEMETLKEEVVKSITFAGEAVAKSVDVINVVEEVEEVEDKAVGYVTKNIDIAEVDAEIVDIVIEDEPQAPIFDADASREAFLDRYKYEATRTNYSRGQLQDIKDTFLAAREGKIITEAAQTKLKQFTEKV